jgi:hypothetical protein
MLLSYLLDEWLECWICEELCLQFLNSPTILCLQYLRTFQERAHDYYNGMTKDQFKKMQEFIAGRGSKKPSSKL